MKAKVINFIKDIPAKFVLRVSLVLLAAVCIISSNVISKNDTVVDNAEIHHMNAGTNEVLDESSAGNTELNNSSDFAESDPYFDLLDSEETILPNQVTVSYSYDTETETIKHGSKTKYSDSMYKGESTVKKGKDGKKEITYCITMIDGMPAFREYDSEKVISEPQDTIKTIGTKFHSEKAVKTSDDVNSISEIKPSKPIELDKNGAPVKYSDIITGKASAYWQGTSTATGVKAKPGYIAVNPKNIPYGTKMYIVSEDGKYVYGYCIAADTGGFAHNGSGRIADLRFNSKSESRKFGVRRVKIYILD